MLPYHTFIACTGDATPLRLRRGPQETAEEAASASAALVSRLEADLFAAVTAAASVSASAASVAAAPAVASGPDAGDAAGAGGGGDKALLAAVTSQRDRFRGRVEALEVELAAAREARRQAEEVAQKAVTDRDELYNKVRFLEAYAAGTVRQAERGVAFLVVAVLRWPELP